MVPPRMLLIPALEGGVQGCGVCCTNLVLSPRSGEIFGRSQAGPTEACCTDLPSWPGTAGGWAEARG